MTAHGRRFGFSPEQKADIAWAVDNAASLRKKYGHKELLICKKEVLGAYDSHEEAYEVGRTLCGEGKFIVIETYAEETIVPSKKL